MALHAYKGTRPGRRFHESRGFDELHENMKRFFCGSMHSNAIRPNRGCWVRVLCLLTPTILRGCGERIRLPLSSALRLHFTPGTAAAGHWTGSQQTQRHRAYRDPLDPFGRRALLSPNYTTTGARRRRPHHEPHDAKGGRPLRRRVHEER